MLAQNPDFYVTPTSGLLELIFGARLNYTNSAEFKAQDSDAMKRAFLAFSRAGMQAYFSALTDKPYVMDKSRGWGVHFDLLQLIFDQEPKVICLVRDLRQILASLEKKFRQNPDKYRAIENHANLSGTTTLKRALLGLQSPPIGLALDRLLEVHQRGWSRKMLFLRFEDLTTQPAAVMQSVYQYLEVPFFEHNFEHVEQVTKEDDDVFGIPGLHEIRPRSSRCRMTISRCWVAIPSGMCRRNTPGTSSFLGITSPRFSGSRRAAEKGDGLSRRLPRCQTRAHGCNTVFADRSSNCRERCG